MKYIFTIIVMTIACVALAQDSKLMHLEKELSFYGDVMVTASEPAHRIRAAARFDSLFTEYLDHEEAHPLRLDFLKSVSVLSPTDSLFQLISWQVKESDDRYDYKGHIVFADGETIPLTYHEWPVDQLEALELDPGTWYGALYYQLMKTGPNAYMIFGFNGNGQWQNLKMADVMIIDENRKISFGAPVFEDREVPGTQVNRLVRQYSSDASFNLNYNPGLKMIIMDHLLQRIGRIPGQGPVNLPDGTYEGYELVDGIWVYREKIYDHTYDEPPRPKPVLDGNKKDIFGKD